MGNYFYNFTKVRSSNFPKNKKFRWFEYCQSFAKISFFGLSRKLYFLENFSNIHACFQQKHNQTYGVLAGGEWALVSVPLKDAGTSHGTVRQCWLVWIMANEARPLSAEHCSCCLHSRKNGEKYGSYLKYSITFIWPARLLAPLLSH